jgi:replicative DNA helicase
MQEHQGMPAAPQIEATVLGAAILDATALREATSRLVPDDFALDSNQRIFRCLREMLDKQQHIDLTTVDAALTTRKELDAVGGGGYLASLIAGVPRHFNIEGYVRIIKDKSLLRQLIRAGGGLQTEGLDASEDAGIILDRHFEHIQGLRTEASDVDLQHVSDYFSGHDGFDSMLERMATTQGINTGIAEFDAATMGYQPKTLSILAARPKMGKTAKMLNDAFHAAVVQGKVTAIFSLEQDRHDCMRRMLSAFSRVPYANIKAGKLDARERRELMAAQSRIMEAPLYITDKPGMTVTRIRTMSEKLKRKVGLDITFIDQLSRFKGTDIYRKGMQERELIGEQTSRLTLMSQELDEAVVLLCQLRRHEGKGDARPQLTDLKSAGDLEEDAGLVELLHCPSYYDSNSQEPDEIIIAAQREGITKTVSCAYNGAIMRWQDIDGDAPAQQTFDSTYYTPPPGEN